MTCGARCPRARADARRVRARGRSRRPRPQPDGELWTLRGAAARGVQPRAALRRRQSLSTWFGKPLRHLITMSVRRSATRADSVVSQATQSIGARRGCNSGAPFASTRRQRLQPPSLSHRRSHFQHPSGGRHASPGSVRFHPAVFRPRAGVRADPWAGRCSILLASTARSGLRTAHSLLEQRPDQSCRRVRAGIRQSRAFPPRCRRTPTASGRPLP